MRIVSLARSEYPLCEGTCAALGMFDGVHLGHRRIITAAKNKSTELHKCTSVLVFSSSPHGALQIMSLDDRLHEFEKLGVNFAFVYDFEQLRNCSPEQFVSDILRGELNAVAVFAGYNYRFGHFAAGDTDKLRALCAKESIFCGVTDRVELLGDAVSSTRIRDLLVRGEIEQANRLLTYPYYLRAEVIHGKQLGRTIGMPTINQSFGRELVVPAHGIYYTKTIIDGKAYVSVSNVGVRPTVEHTENVNLETHIIGFDGDLYGSTVTVEFYGRGRGEEKFSDLPSLAAAIISDCDRAVEFFEKLSD